MAQVPQDSLLGARAIVMWVALGAFVLALFARGLFNDGDTYWHIAAGRWMIDNHAILRIDPFSYTFAGHPWQAHEWLSEVMMALAYVGAGWSGVALLFAVSLALTIAMLGWHLTRRLNGLTLIATLYLSLACMLGSLLARPHLLALLPLEIWLAELMLARDEGRRPSWWLLPVMTLWANLHSSFVLGLLLIVPFALEAMLEKPAAATPEAKRWGLFALAALVASLLTPFGIDGLIFPFKLMTTEQLYAIIEWRQTNLQNFNPLIVAVGAALFVLMSRGAKMKPLRVLVLLGLFYMALAHVRHQILLGVAWPLLLAEPLSQVLKNVPSRQNSRRAVIALMVVLFAAPGALRLTMPVERTDGVTTPASALSHVPASLRREPVLNDYGYGGYLIFNDVCPFIDGRAELYGDAFIENYRRVTRPDEAALKAMLAKYHVRWTIFPAGRPVVGAMDDLAGWRRLYADDFAVVHVRNGTP